MLAPDQTRWNAGHRSLSRVERRELVFTTLSRCGRDCAFAWAIERTKEIVDRHCVIVTTLFACLRGLPRDAHLKALSRNLPERLTTDRRAEQARHSLPRYLRRDRATELRARAHPVARQRHISERHTMPFTSGTETIREAVGPRGARAHCRLLVDRHDGCGRGSCTGRRERDQGSRCGRDRREALHRASRREGCAQNRICIRC